MVTACSTESLRWDEPDYGKTAGIIAITPTVERDSTPHLAFVDICVSNNDGEEITLHRVEVGKLLTILLNAERVHQEAKGSGSTVHRAVPEQLP